MRAPGFSFFICFSFCSEVSLFDEGREREIFNVVQLVLSVGSGVNGFTLDPSLGEFILTHPDIKVNVLVYLFN